MTISGRLNGEPFECNLPVRDPVAGANYLPRIWAKLQIDRLLAENPQANKEQVIALSIAMYVMSPFTSLIVLENDQMYEQYNVDRGRKDHWALYPCPEQIEVVREPLDGPAPSKTEELPTNGDDPAAAEQSSPPPAAEEPKRTTREVLQTILVHVPAPLFKGPSRRSPRHAVYSAWQCGIGRHPDLLLTEAMAFYDRRTGGTNWGRYSVLPEFNFSRVTTYVTVPDRGTVLLGGVMRSVPPQGLDIRDGRIVDFWLSRDGNAVARQPSRFASTAWYTGGVPQLSRLPYTNRLFSNVGLGREGQDLMMMVTPRIIIQEEEEELLGIPWPPGSDFGRININRGGSLTALASLFGGAGYGGSRRPDLSNSSHLLNSFRGSVHFNQPQNPSWGFQTHDSTGQHEQAVWQALRWLESDRSARPGSSWPRWAPSPGSR